jgi:hypothetical protein
MSQRYGIWDVPFFLGGRVKGGNSALYWLPRVPAGHVKTLAPACDRQVFLQHVSGLHAGVAPVAAR